MGNAFLYAGLPLFFAVALASIVVLVMTDRFFPSSKKRKGD